MKRKLKQLELKGTKGWGGKRKNSGRPNLSNTVNHMGRERVNLKTPLHLNLRLKEKLPNLRNKILFKEFKQSVRLAKAQGLYVIHFSIQHNHIHLFAEAENNRALALGMRSLAGRFAKTIRRYAYEEALRRQMQKGQQPQIQFSRIHRSKMQNQNKNISIKSKGSVFAGRYHMHVLKTPREVRNALEYVLLNLTKHQKLIEYIDSYSSAATFKNWKSLLGQRFRSLIKFNAEFYSRHGQPEEWGEVLSKPRSWLASEGWLKAA